ncbi:translation initiation factor 2 [Methylobacterium durans]|uniref:translation initiation factor 2 n=1 Tax=Methylobacterium durans TaxID=2202825 RepID=UPI002AFEA968|nr:translation initiation factor 2 [Methylobacterium durans]MEA1831325.1 translation initiation factor 2 [Methylobacterium durans]
MKPPSSDANRPGSGPSSGPTPGSPQGPKDGSKDGLKAGSPEAGKPGAGPAVKPDAGKPGAAKFEPAKGPGPGTSPVPGMKPGDAPKPAAGTPDPTRSGPAAAPPPKPATPAAEPGKPIAAGPAPGASKPEPGKPEPGKVEPGKFEPGKSEPGKSEPPKVEAGKVDPLKTDAPKPGTASTDPAKPEPGKVESGKSEPGRAEPPRSGFAGNAAPGGKPGEKITDGPILDLKAKRVPEPEPAKPSAGATAATSSADRPATGSATGPATVAPKVAPTVAPTPEPARGGAGFGSLLAASLLGGVVGAGLLLAVEQSGIIPNRGTQQQNAALDQRLAGLAPRDAIAGLEKRVAANEAALKPLPEAVRNAEATAKQALARDGAAPAAPAAEGAPAASGQASVPADLIARLDSLDQRVSALQEEPGRDQPGDSKVTAQQAGDGNPQLAALDSRVKALEDRPEAKPAAGADLAPKLAALQADVESRIKANAEADQAIGQRIDGLQQALDARVKAATEAVQTATQAAQQASEAGKVQAQETAKGLERQLQEQHDRLAALDKAVAQRAEATTVQAALRVVTADRIATALNTGAPYSEPLAVLRKLETGDASRLDALSPFAEGGAPSAAELAAEFRPIAQKIAASRRSAEAKDVAETGDLKQRFLSMADSIIQVRKVDAPAAEGSGGDPAAKVQAALDRGALREAVQAFDAMPEDARAQAGGFATKLKARAAAAQGAQALLSDAFKGLPAPAAPSAAPPETGR